MLLRKKGSLRQSIRGQKCPGEFPAGRESGQTGGITGLFLILFLGVMLCAALQLEHYRAASLYLEDALAASNLASAVVDVREYGISHNILIAQPEEAYRIYRRAVMGNLNLDAAWEGQAGSLVQGPVSIERYIVYNVQDGEVAVYDFDGDGRMSQRKGGLGSVAAPNGIPIESTSVYSEIAFEVEGPSGVAVKARKGNLADISR